MDDRSLYEDQLKLWEQFNYCWLALVQRQLDNSRRVRKLKQPLPQGQTIISKDGLKNLGDELIDLCDGLQCYGFIDYQMGVWETEILTGW